MFLERAANQNNIIALTKLGYSYECIQETVKAVECYTQSAKMGDSSAMTFLGNCYEHGVGVDMDVVAAKEWYVKASAQGNQLARCHLNTMNGKAANYHY